MLKASTRSICPFAVERKWKEQFPSQSCSGHLSSSKRSVGTGPIGHAKYSSPEIEALRKTYRELQQELANTRLELQKKVRELPVVQDKQKQLDAAKERLKEVTKKIAEKTGGAR